MVSLGGLLFSQAVAIIALAMIHWARSGSFAKRLLKVILVIFAFLDVGLQVLQALRLDLTRQHYPTNTDLTDFMLLVSNATGTDQAILKLMLVLISGIYLFAIYRLGLKRAAQPAIR